MTPRSAPRPGDDAPGRRTPSRPPGPAAGRTVGSRPPVITRPAGETTAGFEIHERPAPELVPGVAEHDESLLQGLPFAALDDELPLLLLPVRLETRYRMDVQTPELQIRIYPDQAHVRIRTDPSTGRRIPARPALLPHQWLAIGYRGGEVVFQEPSLIVAPGIRIGPDAAAPTWEVAGAGIAVDDGLAWMFDYDRAVLAGMAITVPLTGTARAAKDGVDVLLVVGVQSDISPAQAADQLGDLLLSHAGSVGFGFIPQGTPTNNTVTATGGPPAETSSGASTSGARLDSQGEGLPDLETVPDLPDMPTVTLQDNASRFAGALGLGRSDVWRDVPFGTDGEYNRSRAMRIALFEAVIGTYARQLLRVGAVDALNPGLIAILRDWFIDRLTGGAPLPCVRIGSQPYGILPVRRATSTATPQSTADQVERVVGLLIDQWRSSAAELPVIDPTAADAGGDETHATTVATVLAGQPHPARLFLRYLEQYSTAAAHKLPFTPQAFHRALLASLDITRPGVEPPQLQIGDRLARFSADGMLSTIDDQIDAWTQIGADMSEIVGAGDVPAGQAIVDGALIWLNAYEERQRPLRWMSLPRYEGALGEQNTELIEGILSRGVAEWGDVGLIQHPDATIEETAAAYLADIRTRLLRRTGGPLPPSEVNPDPDPLLRQMLESSLPLVPAEAAVESQVAAALSTLATVDPESLEWLMRETVGLGNHRLDAWATSLATERLDRLRAGRPDGLQVGAFGWVRELAPRPPVTPAGGYVLTPSPAHATTAAILRSGWQAHGSDDTASATAVDARSDRVRTASWLLEGVRAGRPLADLLGYRFERTLHDLEADRDIRAVRRQVLELTGRGDVAPDHPVDGVVLLELQRSGSLQVRTAAARKALAALTAMFDAVNDLTMLEAVHQLTTGNLERATAVMDSLSLGTQTPPEMRSILTPLAGPSIEHRVVVILDPNPPPVANGWVSGTRDSIAPGLEPWVASLLPPPTAVGITGVTLAADGSRRPFATSLDRLELSALDAIHLVGDDPQRPSAAFEVLAAAAAGGMHAAELDPSDPGQAEITLAEFSVLATELRRAIASWRPLISDDLRSAEVADHSTPDFTAPSAALNALLARLGTQVAHLRDAPDSTAPIEVETSLARIGITASDGSAAGLLASADHRLRPLDSIDEADARVRLERRVAALFAARIPVLGTFERPASGTPGAVRFGAGLATGEQVDEWLDAVGHVRPEVDRLTTSAMLSDLLPGTSGLRAEAGQVPIMEGERWAAVSGPPAGTGGRLCVTAVVAPGGPPAEGDDACGLVVDGWVERIPADQHVAGLALQFDAPGNRPPQSWLLAVPPDGEQWSLTLVVATLMETLEWATLRSVGPEDLLDYGRALPTTAVPGILRVWPPEAG